MEHSRLADFKSSAAARETWQRDNNITTILDPISLNDFLGQQEKPWINNPVYFKQVKMSNLVLLKLVMDASSHECVRAGDIFKLLDKRYKTTREVVGLLMGKIFGNVIIVLDAVALPVDDTETCVDVHSQLLHYFETQKKTQMRIQELMEPSVAVVIDSFSTIDIGKVHIQAFRTYPESYKPPILTCRKDITAEHAKVFAQIAEMTKHWEKRYPLCITHFKYSLTNHVFQELWESYWARLVSMWNNSGSKTVDQKLSVDTLDNKENEGGLTKYSVYVKPKFTKQYRSVNEEAVTGLYARLVEDAGSSKSMISGQTSGGFYVMLTKEQAKKLADNEYVQEARRAYTCYFDPCP
ncbi:COP9 signalosome complex subunit 5b-like isoform X2 [Silene latifolia]|uniref:COP9 signalosome complex subunit 5b-like isoform X2 n=1 Tax=Silene latifolia TaxID=37657 RepID=UPI003D780206